MSRSFALPIRPVSTGSWTSVTSWMLKVKDEYDMSYKTLATAMALLDRVIEDVPSTMVQLYGAVSFHLVGELFDSDSFDTEDVVYVTAGTYTYEQAEECIEDITLKCAGRYYVRTAVTSIELDQKAAFYATVVYLDRRWFGVDPVSIAVASIGLANNEVSYDLMEYIKYSLHTVESYVVKNKTWINELSPGLPLDPDVMDYFEDYYTVTVINPDDNKIIGKAGSNNTVIKSVTNGPYKYALKSGLLETVIPDSSVMTVCDHPNVVKMPGISILNEEGEISLDLYMELMTTDLHRLIYDDPDFIKREWTAVEIKEWRRIYNTNDRVESRIVEHLRRSYAKDMCRGMMYLHSLGILHRDIKPGNILVDNNVAKVCDFGLSTFGVHEGTVLTNSNVYTYMYRPLEVIRRRYGQPADVFALGATLIELEVGLVAFAYQVHNEKGTDYNDHERVIMEVISGGLRCIHDEGYRDLLLRMIAVDPGVRPTMSEVVDAL